MTLRLTSSAGRLDLDAAHTDVATAWSMSSAPTMDVTVHDAARKIVNSAVLDEPTDCHLDGTVWRLAGVSKSGDQVTLTFEHRWAVALRSQEGELAASAGALDRPRFVRRLANDASVPVDVVGAGGGDGEQLARGDGESSWTAIGRLASEAGWRGFLTPDGLVFADDDTLIGRRKPVALREFAGGVGHVDFDVDAGKPADTVSLQVRTDRGALQPGLPVTVGGLRPLRGVWLIASVSRSRYSTATDLDLVRRGSADRQDDDG